MSLRHKALMAIGVALAIAAGAIADAAIDQVADAADAYSAPYSAATAMTDGTVYPSGRAVHFGCTAAGNVKITFANGVALTIPLSAGISVLPYAIVSWTVSGVSGAATCTVANLS